MTPTIDDGLWAALGDPTRRRLVDLLLADGSGTATSLSDRMPVTRQAVAKHLGVLERAELVVPRKDGREVRYVVNEAQFARAVEQLASVGPRGMRDCVASRRSPSRSTRCDRWIDYKRTVLRFALTGRRRPVEFMAQTAARNG